MVADLAPLDGLTNLFYLFLENNKIRDLTPLVNMAKKDFEGVEFEIQAGYNLHDNDDATAQALALAAGRPAEESRPC